MFTSVPKVIVCQINILSVAKITLWAINIVLSSVTILSTLKKWQQKGNILKTPKNVSAWHHVKLQFDIDNIHILAQHIDNRIVTIIIVYFNLKTDYF